MYGSSILKYRWRPHWNRYIWAYKPTWSLESRGVPEQGLCIYNVYHWVNCLKKKVLNVLFEWGQFPRSSLESSSNVFMLNSWSSRPVATNALEQNWKLHSFQTTSKIYKAKLKFGLWNVNLTSFALSHIKSYSSNLLLTSSKFEVADNQHLYRRLEESNPRWYG